MSKTRVSNCCSMTATDQLTATIYVLPIFSDGHGPSEEHLRHSIGFVE